MRNAFDFVLSRLNDAGAKPVPGRRGFACLCPAHGDRNASLNVDMGAGGRVILRCYAGCETTAILDALGLEWGHLFPDGRPYRDPNAPPPKPLPPVLARPVEPVEPVPNRDLLLRIMGHALENVQKECANPWLDKRGLTVETCLKYQVGFMPWIRFTSWRGAVPNVWIIPVENAEGRLVALKLHRENPPAGFSKGSWAPIGTEPADKPRHGFSTLWPPPEAFAPAEKIYLLPGELKALAVLGAGRAATSITAGESTRWTPGLLQRLAGRPVCIVYDDDPAGLKFLATTSAALKGWAASVSKATFGKRKPCQTK